MLYYVAALIKLYILSQLFTLRSNLLITNFVQIGYKHFLYRFDLRCNLLFIQLEF